MEFTVLPDNFNCLEMVEITCCTREATASFTDATGNVTSVTSTVTACSNNDGSPEENRNNICRAVQLQAIDDAARILRLSVNQP